jgi:S1-C subfamily serine protease
MDAQIGLVRALVPSTAALHIRIPTEHPSVPTLGEERMGSAVVVQPGLLLTVNYVVIGGQRIEAFLPDGRRTAARMVAQDYESGLAVLSMAIRDTPAVALGDSRALSCGEEVFILGASGETDRRVSNGVITDLGRFDAYWEYMLDSAIQTSAFNPGFGGSPLFTRLGRLVGITSLSLGQVGRFSLAIPVHLFLDARDDLVRFGHVRGRSRRAWLGVFTDHTPAGLLVAGIVPRSPAAEAGVREGDVIQALNFREVATRQELYRELWRHPAGATIRVTVIREQRSLTVDVASADRADFYR